MKKILFFIFAFVTVVGACKKYEEGPLISFKSAKNRVYGTYTLVSYTVNGQDSLNSYKDSLGINFEFYHNEFLNRDYLHIYEDFFEGVNVVMCKWAVLNKNMCLKFYDSSGPIGIGPFGASKTTEWEILKLKNKDIKLKTEYNSKEYIIELKS